MGNVINTFSKFMNFELFRYTYPKKSILINQSYYQSNKRIDNNNILVKLKILDTNDDVFDEDFGLSI